MENSNGNIIIYQTEDGLTKIDVKLENETVWLSQQQMAELYGTTKQNISLHIKNIFDENELNENSTVKEFLTVYKKYQVKTISPVEQEYLNALKQISSEIKKKDKK